MGKKNIYQHFTTLPLQANTKSQIFECKYCKTKYAKHITRMTKHLYQNCKDCPKPLKDHLQKKYGKKSLPKKTKSNSDDSDDSEDENDENVPSSSKQPVNTKQNSTVSRNIVPYFDKMPEEEVKKLQYSFAKSVYATGTPLAFTDSVHWQQFFSQLRPCFKLPSRKQLSTTLLDKVYGETKNDVEKKIAQAKTVTIECDSWSNIRNEGIINFIVMTPEPVFFKSLEVGEHRQTGAFMAEKIHEIVEEIGKQKVLAVCTDNEAKMKLAWNILENKYINDYIYFYGCLAHVLNLLVSDILHQVSANNVLLCATSIVKEIKRSHLLAAIFSEIQKLDVSDTQNISLKLPIKTRWGSALNCLQSLYKNKHNLQSLAISPKATSLNSATKTLTLDEEFWTSVKKLIDLIKPLTVWIFKAESNESKINEISEIFQNIRYHFDKIFKSSLSLLTSTEAKTVMICLEKRSKMALRPIHFAANILDPKRKGQNLNSFEYIAAHTVITNVALKLGLNKDIIFEELTAYVAAEGFWSLPFVQESIRTISNCITWWKSVCKPTQLSKVAIQILNLPCTSAATERSFSTHGWIHSAKRNRLTSKRAAQIAYIAHNLRDGESIKCNPSNEKCQLLENIDEDSSEDFAFTVDDFIELEEKNN